MTDASSAAAAPPTDTFAAEWLALREPADHRSRAAELVAPLREAWVARRGTRIVDLGAGTGSNLRWLRPKLPGAQRWTLVDRDRALLERADGREDGGSGEAGQEVEVVRVHGDLGREGLQAVADADLVTASALLDLVGVGWMEEWVDACRRAGCLVYVALSYDGTVRWERPDDGARDDAEIIAAVNAHQRRDKGTGRALGPDAAGTAEALFRAAGYRTRRVPSPWRLGPEDAALARALTDGWAGAAREMLPHDAARVDAWAERRRDTIASGRFRLIVGHEDLLALPAGSTGGGA